MDQGSRKRTTKSKEPVDKHGKPDRKADDTQTPQPKKTLEKTSTVMPRRTIEEQPRKFPRKLGGENAEPKKAPVMPATSTTTKTMSTPWLPAIATTEIPLLSPATVNAFLIATCCGSVLLVIIAINLILLYRKKVICHKSTKLRSNANENGHLTSKTNGYLSVFHKREYANRSTSQGGHQTSRYSHEHFHHSEMQTNGYLTVTGPPGTQCSLYTHGSTPCHRHQGRINQKHGYTRKAGISENMKQDAMTNSGYLMPMDLAATPLRTEELTVEHEENTYYSIE